MKFILGLLTGLVLGAVGAVAYSVQSGRDLRQAFEDVRSDLEKRDVDELGARLEARFSAMQTQLEHRLGEMRDRATSAREQAGEAAEGAAKNAQQVAEDLGATAKAAAEDVQQAAEAAVEEVKEQAAEDQAGA
jgi:gas vesicle protein